MIAFLSKLNMTIQDYAIMAVVAIIGGLVAALKLQGFQLHRAQVQLLKGQIEAKEARNAEVTQKAYDTYKDALNSYIQAGGTLLVLAFLWFLPTQARADVGQSCPLESKCSTALKACDALQVAQGNQIKEMRGDITTLENKVVSEEHSKVDVGTVSGGVSGAIVGGAIGGLKGFFIGGPVGLCVGIAIGTLMGGGL